jgi:hypothetical protein
VVRAAVEVGQLIALRVVTCGSGLTTTRGHCHFFSIEVDTVDGLRTAVADQARAGADFIRVFATGGRLTPGTSRSGTTWKATAGPEVSFARLRATNRTNQARESSPLSVRS